MLIVLDLTTIETQRLWSMMREVASTSTHVGRVEIANKAIDAIKDAIQQGKNDMPGDKAVVKAWKAGKLHITVSDSRRSEGCTIDGCPVGHLKAWAALGDDSPEQDHAMHVHETTHIVDTLGNRRVVENWRTLRPATASRMEPVPGALAD